MKKIKQMKLDEKILLTRKMKMIINIEMSLTISPNALDDKIKLLKTIFKDVVNEGATDLELSDIANEVINDNVENLLLNNVVIENVYNPNEIKHTDTESIWLNINDITNWFKKYEIN